jgi:hypothetical protein
VPKFFLRTAELVCCVIMVLAVHPEIIVKKLKEQFGNNRNVAVSLIQA